MCVCVCVRVHVHMCMRDPTHYGLGDWVPVLIMAMATGREGLEGASSVALEGETQHTLT